MEPQQNTGSFGAAISGTQGIQSLKAAMQRRGIDTSVLDQVSPAAPGPESPVAPPLPEGAGGLPQGTEQSVAQSVVGPQKQEAPFKSGESEIATKALKSIIDTDNAVTKSMIKLQGA